MPKINVDSSYRNHPKTQRLKLYCGSEADIFPVRLWLFCAEYFPKDGILKGYTGPEIETILDFKGAAGNLISALLRVGFVVKVENDYAIKDWREHAGFIWNYRMSGKRNGRKSSESRSSKRKSFQQTVNKPFNGLSTNPSTMEWNGIELNRDSIAVPTNPPELTDVQKTVNAWKVLTGYKLEDKGWDKLNFARCTKPAKQLLEFIGNLGDTLDCIQDVYEKFTAKNLTVTLETVSKHAADWKKDLQEVDQTRQ